MAILDFLSRKLDAADYETIGINISEKSIFTELAFYIAVSYYSESISNCEFKTYENGEEVKNELYYMLNVSPNPNQNAAQFKKKLIESYFYNTETLAIPFVNHYRLYIADGFSREEHPLTEDVFSNIAVGCESISKQFKSSEVFYFEQENRDIRQLVNILNGEYGKLISAAIDAYRRGHAEKYKLLLDNIEAGNQTFAKQYREVIKGQLETFLNSDRAVYPQFRGQVLERMPNQDQATSDDIIHIRKEIFESVAQAFKIPLSMMYGNITNVNDIVKTFLTFGLDPVANIISTEFTRKMYPFEEWKNGNFIKVDTSQVNHVSILEVADKVDKAIGSGYASIDDMRLQVGWEPLETDYSEAHFMTKNYAPADSMLDNLEGGEMNE